MVPLYLQQVRAYTERYPSAQGNLASAYEDLYPTIGGAGYNGCVASFYLKETYGPGTKDAANTALHPAMKGVYMRFYTQARGAGYHHALRPNLAHRAERVQRPRCQRQRPLHLHQPHRLLRPRARRGRRHEIVVPLFGGYTRSNETFAVSQFAKIRIASQVLEFSRDRPNVVYVGPCGSAGGALATPTPKGNHGHGH